MANSNCLENITCPECRNESAFYIDVSVLAFVTDSGAEAANGNFHWDAQSRITCGECDHAGTVGQFTAPLAASRRTFRVTVKRTFLEWYSVEARSKEEAMVDWMDGDFRGQDEEALDSEPLKAVEVKP